MSNYGRGSIIGRALISPRGLVCLKSVVYVSHFQNKPKYAGQLERQTTRYRAPKHTKTYNRWT